MYGWTMFTPRIMKEYLHTANTLRAYSEGFEVSDYLVRLFPLAILESLGNGKWQDILQEVLHAINKMRQTAYEGIFKLIIPCILAQNRHSIQLHDKKQFCLVWLIPLFSFFMMISAPLTKQHMCFMPAMLWSILELKKA